MENPTSFDLNFAIRRWRNALVQSPALQGEDLDELESHLRDAVRDLHARGLSEEEAVSIAVRRMGWVETLAEEFGKVNAVAVWRDRALWMLAGMMLLFTVGGCINAAFSALIYLGSMFSSDGIKLGWAGVAARITAFTMLAWMFWRLANGRFNGLGRLASRFNARPVLWAAGVILCLALLNAAQFLFQMLYTRNLGPMALGQSYLVMNWWFAVFPLLQGALIIMGFTSLWRRGISGMAARRAAGWALVLPVAIGLTLASANAQTNSAPSKTTGTDKQVPAMLNEAMTLWRADKKEEAVAKFLAVDFTKRPLFPTGSVLNYTEVQFMALPDAARNKMAKQMQDDLQVIKQICAHVRDTGEGSQTTGDKAKADKCAAQLLKCGAAFDQPDSLALLKFVGKALIRMAATAPKN